MTDDLAIQQTGYKCGAVPSGAAGDAPNQVQTCKNPVTMGFIANKIQSKTGEFGILLKESEHRM